MLVSEIATRVYRQFGDQNGVQITDDDIIRWINSAIKDISYAGNLLQARATADVVAGQSEYSLPNDLFTLHNVRLNGLVLKAYTIQEADTIYPDHDNPDVQAITGTPQCYWIWAETLVLYPTPDTSGDSNLRVYYTKNVSVSATTDTLPLPAQYDTAIEAYCLKKAYELDENFEAAQLQRAEFTNSVSTMQEDVSFAEREAYPSVQVSDRDGTYGD